MILDNCIRVICKHQQNLTPLDVNINQLLFWLLWFSSENFLKLKVYYGELNFEVIEEEPAYQVG